MTRINTNVASLVGQNQLGRSNADLNQALTRLSTGLRINTGKDDPAGLIASENLRSDITSIRRAISNTDRATQVIATADSALGQVSSLLNDIRGLVTESANSGALSQEQIDANQLQVDSSLEALNRIAQTTTFQGRRLLDGSLDFLTTAGANSTSISNIEIDQANLGATGQIAVDVNVTEAATQASVAVADLPDVTPTTTTELAIEVQTQAASASTGSVDFDVVTADTVQSITDIALATDTLTLTALEDGSADGDVTYTIAVTDTNDASGTATAAYDENTNVLTIDADITGGVGSDDVAAAIALAQDGNGDTVFAAVSDGTTDLVGGDEATIEGFTVGTGGNVGVDEVVTTESIDITGTLAAGADGNVAISFSEEALGGGNPSTNVIGNATTGYTIQLNTDVASIDLDDIATAVATIDEVDTAVASANLAFNGIDVGGVDPDVAPGTVSLANGQDATRTDQIINITTAIGFTGNFDITLDASTNTSGAVIVTGDVGSGFTVNIDSTAATTIEDIRAEIESQIAEVGTATLGQNTTGTNVFDADDNGDTVPATLNIVGAGAGSETTGLNANLVFELAGSTGSEVLSFEGGTTVGQLLAGVNAVSDATGVTASLDDDETGIVLSSSGYGSDSYVDLQVIDEGTGDNPAGAFTDAVGQGTRATGADVVATVNGISATGDGNSLSINTATLDLSATLAADFEGSTTFTITGGGALFQLGPDVVSNQQARLGINSVNTAALGGIDGLLYQLGTGGTADLTADPNTAAKIVESAIDQVTGLRGRLGAFQRTTLETNKNALNDTLTNLTEAESSIRDADFASESAALTRAQILVQSGTNVLSIANQNPQNVLALLR